MPVTELPSVEELARRLGGDILRAGEILCLCPIHEADGGSHQPSCILKLKSGRLLAHCRSANCDKENWPAFRAALAAKADIPEGLVGARRGTGPEGIRYDYRWPKGDYSWSKQRTETPTGRKSFRSGVWDERLGWTAWSRPVNAVPLYGLPEVAQALVAAPDTVVLIVEGEKDVDTAKRLGLPATSAADGTRWPALGTDILVRLGVRRVAVLPDNDAAGIAHGIRVADALQDAGITVAWLALPGLKTKGDLSDWVDEGGSRAALYRLLSEAPEYDPEAFQWKARLVPTGPMATATWRGGNDGYNLGLALQHHPELRGAFRFNEFRQRVEVTRDLPWKTMGDKLTPIGYRAREDEDITNLGAFLVADMDFAPFNIDTLDRGMRAEAGRSTFDEAKLWLDRLSEWDGVPRVDTFWQTYFGAGLDAEEPERSVSYLAMMSFMFFGQIIRRIHKPGCQADYSPVFYADQGEGKDRGFRTLLGEYLSESAPSLKAEKAGDRARVLAGYLVIHDAEMASFAKASEAERKAALTKSHDRGRFAYAREVSDVPRRATFTFTVNIKAVLVDVTGNRRYWPGEMVRPPDCEAIERDRLQLFAEAKARVAAGEPDWPHTPEREALLLWGQRTFRPDAILDLEQFVDRYLTDEPIRAKPAPGDTLIGWAWKARSAPLTALTIGRFFEKVLGEVVGVGGGRHASPDHVTAVTVYLRHKGWTSGWAREADVVADEDERKTRRTWRAPEAVNSERGPTCRGRSGGPRGTNGSAEIAIAAARPTAPEIKNAKAKQASKTDPDRRATPKTPHNSLKSHNLDTNQNLSGSPAAGGYVAVFSNAKAMNLKKQLKLSTAVPDPDRSSGRSATLLIGVVSGTLDPLVLTPTPYPQGLGATLRETFRDAPMVALDFETSGLDAARDGIRTAQFCDGDTVAMVVYSAPQPAAQALAPLRDFLTTVRLVAHPAHFEGAWLHAAGLGDVVLDDTALMWAAAHGGGNPWKGRNSAFVPIALRDLAKVTLGIELDKEEQLSDWSAAELSPAQLQYAARDAVVTARIWDRLVDDAEARSRKSAIDVFAGYDDLRKSNALALSMERAGVAFDLAAHKAWTEATAREAGPLRDRITALEPALVADKALNSGKQLNAAIARRLEAMPGKERRLARLRWPRTPKGVDLGFSKDALADVLAAGHLSGDLRDLVQALHDLKALTGRLTLFGDGFRKHVGKDGRLRGHFYAAGAVTGRYVSQDPNVQNIFEDFRTYLVAPPGRVLVAADYSQLELRVLAAISRCPGMTAAFARGDDYHAAVARDAGVDRRQAKAINFGVVYGKGAESLARELGVDQSEAQDYLDRWATGAPGAAIFLNQAPDDYARNGGIATARRWIDMVTDADASSKAGTRPRNYPIQGTAGDVLHRAMALLLDRIPSWPGSVVPLLTVHDEIVLEVDRADADEVARLLPETMSEAFADILPDGPALHLVFGGVGDTWLSAKKQGSAREKAARSAEVR